MASTTSDYFERVEYYEKRFAEGAKLSSSTEEALHLMEWTAKGLKTFKRKVLGLCGNESTKSLDELTKILTEMNVLSSAEEGKEFIRGLYGTELPYEYSNSLGFTKVKNRNGDESCQITKRPYGHDMFNKT